MAKLPSYHLTKKAGAWRLEQAGSDRAIFLARLRRGGSNPSVSASLFTV